VAEAATVSLTRDAFLDGRLLLTQPATGHRIGTDAVLLLALVRGLLAARRDQAGWRVADFGAGAGLIGLGLAVLDSAVTATLIERNGMVAALAEDNRLALAGEIAARCRVVEADVTMLGTGDVHRDLRGVFDVVAMNPPYLIEGRARLSPSPYRAAAHAQLHGSPLLWFRAARRVLKPGGQLAMIHRADALPAILAGLATGFGAVRIVPVHPRDGADATRILVSATLQSRAPAAIGPALVLHGPDGGFTPAASALHAGNAVLPMA
jgi:tRNA1(Val) A37 N6-methylase TrmN6